MSLLVYLQNRGKKLHQVSLEIVSKAIELSKQNNERVDGIYIGKKDEHREEQFENIGLDTIYIYETEEQDTVKVSVEALKDCIDQTRPSIVLVGGTLEGRAIAPQVAAIYHTGVTADCTELQINKDGLLVQTRPAFGGNIMADIITPLARPQMATVRQGIFQVETQHNKVSKICYKKLMTKNKTIKVLECQVAYEESEEKKDTIIAVGGGITNQEELEIIRRFCRNEGVPLMCSRALVERGWLEQKCQIGLSGKSIRCKTLITLGISGSVQFMVGVRDVDALIAMNIDDKAPIMTYADQSLCVDIRQVLDCLKRDDI